MHISFTQNGKTPHLKIPQKIRENNFLEIDNASKRNLEIINANSRNTQLLVSLGIDLLLKLDTEGKVWPEIRNQISNYIQNEQYLDIAELSKEENVKQSLEAHQNLSNANKNNVPRFRDVIHFLEKELGQQSAS